MNQGINFLNSSNVRNHPVFVFVFLYVYVFVYVDHISMVECERFKVDSINYNRKFTLNNKM